MWKTSWTSVSPSATSPASTSPAPARMSDDHTGALDSCGMPRTTAWWPSVRASAPEPDHLLDEPEPRLEHVLGDHRRAVGDRRPARSPSAAGRSGNPGNGSVATLTALGRSYCTTRKPLSCLGDRRAGVVQLVQHQLQVLRVDAGDRDVAAGHRRGDAPRGGDDAVADHPVLGGMQLGRRR